MEVDALTSSNTAIQKEWNMFQMAAERTKAVVNHLYFLTNALNCIKLIWLKSICINILKDN